MATQLKASETTPSITDHLSLFGLPPTETGVEKRYFVDYRPVSQLVDDSSPIEFSFVGSVDMVDLKNTELHVKARIVDSSGGNIEK